MKFSEIKKSMNQVSPPIQPKIRLNVKDYSEIVLEWNPVSIKKHALFYQFVSGPNPDCISLIPDGCINVLFKCDEKDPKITLSGIMLKENPLILDPNTTYFGFKPYSIVAVKDERLKFVEFLNESVELDYCLPDTEQLKEKILLANDLKERMFVLIEYAKKYLINYDYIYDVVEHLAITMCISKGQNRIGDLTSTIGYTERHCRTKFKDKLGINLSNYNGIMRFQNAVKSFYKKGSRNMTGVAHDAGFFDQSHFIREFKKYASDSPTQFKNSFSI